MKFDPRLLGPDMVSKAMMPVWSPGQAGQTKGREGPRAEPGSHSCQENRRREPQRRQKRRLVSGKELEGGGPRLQLSQVQQEGRNDQPAWVWWLQWIQKYKIVAREREVVQKRVLFFLHGFSIEVTLEWKEEFYRFSRGEDGKPSVWQDLQHSGNTEMQCLRK